MLKITLFLVISVSCFAQISDSESLINVHNVSDLSAMNNIANPEQGNLVFVESTNTLYFYDSNNWVSISTSGSGDGDAWGVNGEDISSEITRTGKVTIGAPSNTSEILEVRGATRIQTLGNEENLRGMTHDLTNNQINSDRHSSFYSQETTTNWQNLNPVGRGLTITGFYNKNIASCGTNGGHFLLRYYTNTNTFGLAYNTGNAMFIAAAGQAQLVGNGCFSVAGVQFRSFGGQIQVSTINTTGLELDLRIEGY
jgi:hypothetical protein